MSSKPLTEVLAQLYVAERYKLDPEHQLPWENMSDVARAAELGGLVEVVRILGLLGWEVFSSGQGVGVRPIKRKTTRLTREQTDEMQKQTNPLLTQGEISQPMPLQMPVSTPQFTGRPCDHCQSLNTIQNGKCLLCMECGQTGECG